MVWIKRLTGLISATMVLVVLSPSLQSFPPAEAIRSSHLSPDRLSFRRSPPYSNTGACRSGAVCDPNLVHVAITLDVEYLRGSIAAVHSALQHSRCPESVYFHFVVSASETADLETLVGPVFPELNFRVYTFDPNMVKDLISTTDVKGSSSSSSSSSTRSRT